MDVIKSLAPTDACCSSWQKRHFPWTERVKKAVHSLVLGYCELGGERGEETGAPAVTVRRRAGCFPYMFTTGCWMRCPRRVWVTRIKSTRDHLCYLQKSFVMCFPDQKVKEWGLELRLERLQKKPVWKRTVSSKKRNRIKGMNSKSKNLAAFFQHDPEIQKREAGSSKFLWGQELLLH